MPWNVELVRPDSGGAAKPEGLEGPPRWDVRRHPLHFVDAGHAAVDQHSREIDDRVVSDGRGHLISTRVP
jgi:hypothetical protein